MGQFVQLVLAIFLLIQAVPAAAWGISFIVGVVDVLLLIITYPIYYAITPPFLHVHSGVIHVKIPLTSIQHVSPDDTRGSPVGLSFAWSLDHLRVDYRHRRWPTCLYIAPKDKITFMQDLAQQTPGLEFKDGEVIRRQ